MNDEQQGDRKGEMLSAEELQAIRERADKATAGPWSVGDFYLDDCHTFGAWAVETENHIPPVVECQEYPPYFVGGFNAEFIAHARSDVPRLLALVEMYRNLTEGLINGTISPKEARDALQEQRGQTAADDEVARAEP
jgi:hypothetical protein